MPRPRKLKEPNPRAARPLRARRKVPRVVREVQMLDVAGSIFAKRGYHAASMDEIASAAGITKPMLYAYFGSKEGLYLATIQRVGAHLMESVQVLQQERDPDERLRLGARAMLGFIDRHRDGWAVMYNEAIAGSSPVAKQVGKFREQIIVAIAEGIRDLAGVQGRGDRRGVEPFAHALLGAGEAMAQWWLKHPEESLDAMVDRVMLIAEPLLRLRATRGAA